MASTPKPASTRKPSRVYEDLAWMIVLPKHPMASMVLRYLARLAGDSGTCFPGFALISAVCNGASHSSIADALEFLYSLGLLTLTSKGHGNQHSFYNKSNVYQLNADAMLRLVEAQEVFAPERKGACLFKGRAKDLADKVKALTLEPAELSERFAKYDGRVAELSDRPAEYDDRLAELSHTTLTLIEPLIEPQVQYNQYFVVMEVAPKYWQQPQDLNRIFLSTAAGNVTGTQQTQMPAGTVKGVTPFASVASRVASSSANALNANAQANLTTNAISNSRGGASSGSADSTAAETMVPLSALAKAANNHTAIQVNHQSGLIAATISFNLPPGGSLSSAQAAIDAAMRTVGAPASIHGGFQGSAQVFAQSLSTIPLLILAALVAVYIVLGILYENTIHPLTILSTLPSAGIGATLALLLFGVPFSMIALIGIILLIGIVKKNAIMMIDVAIHLERNQKRPAKEAIHEAAVVRLRPIMMTTAAAVLGALPLAIGIGQGASLRQPLGITVMGGLLLSQIFTLFTTPVIYLSLDRLRGTLGGLAFAWPWRRNRQPRSNA